MVLSMVAFILSMLCLFAGHKEGFMEDYSVARVSLIVVLQTTYSYTDKLSSTLP